MFRFTIRDVLWLTVVAALAVGWSIDHGMTVAALDESERNARELKAARDEYLALAYKYKNWVRIATEELEKATGKKAFSSRDY